MPVMRVLSHIALKSKIHLPNYSGIWYTARHPHITEKYWSYGPRFAPPAKNPAGAPADVRLTVKKETVFVYQTDMLGLWSVP